jgi:hypothetical protein
MRAMAQGGDIGVRVQRNASPTVVTSRAGASGSHPTHWQYREAQAVVSFARRPALRHRERR